jgi:hypothetical protein
MLILRRAMILISGRLLGSKMQLMNEMMMKGVKYMMKYIINEMTFIADQDITFTNSFILY